MKPPPIIFPNASSRMHLSIADLFCGAGGTSSGAVEAISALGRKPMLTAINHWPVAIDTHTANHPGARHFCTGIDSVNPRDLFEEGGLDILWASPECTHHSVARGGRPINDQSRATAWCVVRWAEAMRPPVILIENVPEFQSWGPIGANGRPLASKKGETFKAWKAALESLGYRVDARILCAADYGDPTTRSRLFVQAVRRRRRIVWPTPTHSKDGAVPGTLPWVGARSIIDWSLAGKSIHERDRPLSPKTIARIHAGLRKFGLKTFIVPQQSNPTPKSVDDPLPTVVAEGSDPKLVDPFIVAFDNGSSSADSAASSIDTPLSTIVTKARHGVAEPFLVSMRGSEPSHIKSSARPLDDPAPALTAGGTHLGLAEPFLVKTANGESRGSEGSRCKSLDDPMPTVCGNRGDVALVEPFIISAGGPECGARPVGEPMGTVLTRDHRAIVEPMLLPQHSGAIARPVSHPVPTVTTTGAISLVEPVLTPVESEYTPVLQDGKQIAVNGRPLFEIHGRRYLLDIRFRMLQPHELAGAQGFPKDYKFTGNKTHQVKQIGNAVPRRLARALLTAALTQQADISWLVADEHAPNVVTLSA